MPKITFRRGSNRETKHVNGATNPNSNITSEVGTKKPQENDNPTVSLTIAAVRALGVLCIKVSDILDCTSRDRGLPAETHDAVAEIKGVSLDPSTFVDPEEEEGNAA